MPYRLFSVSISPSSPQTDTFLWYIRNRSLPVPDPLRNLANLYAHKCPVWPFNWRFYHVGKPSETLDLMLKTCLHVILHWSMLCLSMEKVSAVHIILFCWHFSMKYVKILLVFIVVWLELNSQLRLQHVKRWIQILMCLLNSNRAPALASPF